MSTKQMETDLFGKQVSFDYSTTWLGYSLVVLRVVMGWVFFYAGITKVLDPEWTAAGYLNHVSAENPFGAEFWATMAGNPIIDALNQWGLTLIGIALILGVAVRWSAFWGAVMMVFYWASSLPLQHAIIIDDHIVYALILFGLGAFGAGRVLGLDKIIEETEFVKKNSWIKYLTG